MSTGKSQPPLPLRKPPGYRDPATKTQHPVQPRKPVKLPPTFQKTKRRRSCCRIFCCCLCLSIFILILIFAVAGFVFYFWFQPRLPEIHLKSITFTEFNITKNPGPTLDAQSTVDVVIKNPNNNFGLVYGRTRILLSAVNGDVNLGEQTVGGFNQDSNNVTTLRVAMKAQNEILDGKSAEELERGFKNKNLMMNAEIRSGIGLKHNRWSMNPVQVSVVCVGMSLDQLQRGGSTPKCRVKVLDRYALNLGFLVLLV